MLAGVNHLQALYSCLYTKSCPGFFVLTDKYFFVVYAHHHFLLVQPDIYLYIRFFHGIDAVLKGVFNKRNENEGSYKLA